MRPHSAKFTGKLSGYVIIEMIPVVPYRQSSRDKLLVYVILEMALPIGYFK